MAEQSTFDRVMAQIGKPPESALANIFAAYEAGKMPPADAAQFEKDVRDGRIMLPKGAVLKGTTPGAAVAPPAPAGVIAAYNDGRMSAEDKAAFDQDVRDGKWSLPANLGIANGSIAARIPQTPQVAEPPAPELGLVDKAIGTGEAALSTATGFTGGTLGMIGGTLKGLAEQILSGQFGTPQAANLVEQAANAGAQGLTYQPRTAIGQQYTNVINEAAQNLAPIAAVAPGMAGSVAPTAPARVMARAGMEGTARDVASGAARAADFIAPGVADVAKIGEAAAGMAGAGIDAAAKVASLAKGVTTLPRRALESLRAAPDAPTLGTMGSVGAAGTDMATIRRATAQDLGFTGDAALTKGQATRNAEQLKFEAEAAKNPELGAPLRDRATAQTEAIHNTFDHWADQTGAQAPNARAVGTAVDRALVEKATKAKTEIKARYKAAERAGEMESPVVLDSVVQHLNESAPDAAVAPLLTTARARAIQTGIATEGPNGQLLPQPVPLKIAETYRQAIGAATDYTPTNVRQATIIKGLIDQTTDGMGGNLYKTARAARARYAQEFENSGVISKLLNNKKGTADRQVAFEDVHKHSILDGSLDDVRKVRTVLQTGGENGRQAWRELQGATLRHIRQTAETTATDAKGNRVFSPAALDKTIRALDTDGKLDFIFGKKGAQQLRDLRDLAQYVKTAPPESAINHSNTAATMAAFADVAFSGMSGVPVPIATVARLGLRQIKDAGLRKRVNEALNEQAAKQAPGRSRFKAPPIDPSGGTPPGTMH